MKNASEESVALQQERRRNRFFAFPAIFAFLFLFFLFLPFSGWLSALAGIGKPWITFSSALLSSAVSVLGLVAAYVGGEFLPRSLNPHTSGR